ncbi:hypothetical protein A3A66_00420 [Microgenomates group bacterium RIFCSPLOWO2_01_FULL_46_13]|nr:MAG: hypothetical protein A2783_03940 [Microgenomates group bacterium RIFCSPHIGHO2_01_FULL_45_11]OGV94479.1 MAG: hypothetical protein A3A66_00420 [Microgenomates group bacterium RIFCSPLOWO2_01_FULL_46_13]
MNKSINSERTLKEIRRANKILMALVIVLALVLGIVVGKQKGWVWQNGRWEQRDPAVNPSPMN